MTASSEPPHLALPEADPQLLAHGLVLMKAARQAAELVEQEEAAAKEPLPRLPTLALPHHPHPHPRPPARRRRRLVESKR